MYAFDGNEHDVSYNEVLSFNGGLIMYSPEHLSVKNNGIFFICNLTHYGADTYTLTETYMGHLDNGMSFRFTIANEKNPFFANEPMVSFGSISRNGWAVHF